MIESVGLDLVEVARIERAMRRERFLTRILTPAERQRPLNAQRVAGLWAAKEAVAKAVSCDLRWHDVEVRHKDSGAPEVWIRPEVLGRRKIHLSISHERGMAAAVVVLESAP